MIQYQVEQLRKARRRAVDYGFGDPVNYVDSSLIADLWREMKIRPNQWIWKRKEIS